MRAQLVGKWIKDTIDDIDTWLLVVAVEINTENVVSTNKRYASKKQEIFGAKVNLQLYFKIHEFRLLSLIIVLDKIGRCICTFPI
jgi:hypothetical protein